MEKRIKATVTFETSVLENAKRTAEAESMPFSTWLSREVKHLLAKKGLSESSNNESSNNESRNPESRTLSKINCLLCRGDTTQICYRCEDHSSTICTGCNGNPTEMCVMCRGKSLRRQ